MQTERADHTAHNDILSLVPQQYPFRFLDRILELDEQHIVGQYTFDPNLPFYQGHPGGSTPETILVETMAQTAVVALGLYLIERVTLKYDVPNIGKHNVIIFKGAWASQRF